MRPFFIIDVESIGLHGEAYAVAGGIYVDGVAIPGSEFTYACDPSLADGVESDREWCRENIPEIQVTHASPEAVKNAFWTKWREAKESNPELQMAAECQWPVETNFLSGTIALDPEDRRWKGPYPIHDIATAMLSAGMDPMKDYQRLPNELPKHDPLADIRQSARLLSEALRLVNHQKVDILSP